MRRPGARYDPEREETLEWRVVVWLGTVAEVIGAGVLVMSLFSGGLWHLLGILLTLAGGAMFLAGQLGARLRLRRFRRRRHRIP